MKRFILTAALALGLTSAVMAQTRARLPQPISFWNDIAAPIDKHNPLTVRPSTFLLFEDGQWVLEDMHWTGWGSSVARATGISSASNDIPNAAQGKRIKTRASVTLSDPGRFEGHEVYRCFKLTVPGPASYGPQPLCLGRSAGAWVLKSNALSLSGFLSPDGKVWCGIGSPQSFCVTGGEAAGIPQSGATLYSSGKVTLCDVPVPSASQGCTQNWDPGAQVLTLGQENYVDGVVCKSETTGITCTLVSGRGAGKGFLISSTTLRRIGP